MSIALQLLYFLKNNSDLAEKFPFGMIFLLSITQLEHSKMENVPPLNDCAQKRTSGFPLPNYRHSRVLPHINEEYDFHINNRLLIQKIINPRRDKTIINSLGHTSCKYFSKKKQDLMQQASTCRRKVLMNRKSKQNLGDYQSVSRLSKKGQSNPFPSADNDDSQKERLRQSQSLQKWSDDYLGKREDLVASGWMDTQSSSLRDNYVGRIIRNGNNSSKISAKRITNLSNFCEMTQSNEFFAESATKQDQPGSKRMHNDQRIRRLIRKNIKQKQQVLYDAK